MGLLQDLINSGFLAKVLPIIFFTNIGLSALNLFFGKLAQVTGNKTESDIAQAISSASSMIQQLLNFAGYNPPAPQSTPAQLKRKSLKELDKIS